MSEELFGFDTTPQKQAHFGEPGLVGQDSAKEQIQRILNSERVGHAYLFVGPKGCGKTAFALAMAEWVNGIEHLSKPIGNSFSSKATWATHPDIHLFFPIPVSVTESDRKARMELLKNDPYEIVDYALRPSITGTSGSKNQRAFYSIQYFRETIRPVTVLKPNEGRRTVVILTSIDTMRAETANAFLKLLEEPSGQVLFILTAESSDSVLPTIRSRCQQIRFQPLSMKDVQDALIERDGFSVEDASYLARLTDGFYALAKFQDIDQLRESRNELIQFLRSSYTQDAPELLRLIQSWNTRLNLEGQLSLLNSLELILRDVLLVSETGEREFITHQDQADVIQKIASTLQEANLDEMIRQISEFRTSLMQNVQFKLIMPVIALRFFSLMRGKEPVLSSFDPWKHIPAFVDS